MPVVIDSLNFPNPIGLAAGLDKDGKYLHELALLGFGFIEIGTVTPRPQPGNPKPRLFRLIKDQALINRMGFNNEGVEIMARRLQNRPKNLIVGGNIGKNKDTPNEHAIRDYLYCFEKLQHLVDYFVVNVSSPNTPGLRELQEKEPLEKILSALQEKNQNRPDPLPLYLKIAPDLSDSQLGDICDIVNQTGIQGVVCTNTTLDRTHLKTSPVQLEKIGAGGLSGVPVFSRSTEVLSKLRNSLGPKVTLIGVGGIHQPDQALEKFKNGADLIQIYTGFVYEGPALIKRILRKIKT